MGRSFRISLLMVFAVALGAWLITLGLCVGKYSFMFPIFVDDIKSGKPGETLKNPLALYTWPRRLPRIVYLSLSEKAAIGHIYLKWKVKKGQHLYNICLMTHVKEFKDIGKINLDGFASPFEATSTLQYLLKSNTKKFAKMDTRDIRCQNRTQFLIQNPSQEKKRHFAPFEDDGTLLVRVEMRKIADTPRSIKCMLEIRNAQ